MKKSAKRSLSILLVLIMLLGLIPTTVLADEKIPGPIGPIIMQYKVTYDPNGGTFLTVKGSDSTPIVKNVPAKGSAVAPEPLSAEEQTAGTVIAPDTPVEPVWYGTTQYGAAVEHRFLGWSTEKRDPGAYSDADKYNFSTLLKGSLTLYAMWDNRENECSISSGYGSVRYYAEESDQQPFDEYILDTMACTAIIAPNSKPTKAGYVFKGWKVKNAFSAGNKSYAKGDSFEDFNLIVSVDNYEFVAEWKELTNGYLQLNKSQTGLLGDDTMPTENMKFTITGTSADGTPYGPREVTYQEFVDKIEVPIGEYTVTEDLDRAKVKAYTVRSSVSYSSGKSLFESKTAIVEDGKTSRVSVTNTYSPIIKADPIDDIKVKKVDQNGDPIPGVVFKLRGSSGPGVEVLEVNKRTNEIGEFTITNDDIITAAMYGDSPFITMTETSVPGGYIAGDPVSIVYGLEKSEDGEGFVRIVTVGGDYDEETRTLTIENKKIETADKITVKKVDQDGNPMGEVGFVLQTRLPSGYFISKKYETNDSGEFVIETSELELDKQPESDSQPEVPENQIFPNFTLTETVRPGYTTEKNPYEGKFIQQGNTYLISIPEVVKKEDGTCVLKVVNKKQSCIIITKKFQDIPVKCINPYFCVVLNIPGIDSGNGIGLMGRPGTRIPPVPGLDITREFSEDTLTVTWTITGVPAGESVSISESNSHGDGYTLVKEKSVTEAKIESVEAGETYNIGLVNAYKPTPGHIWIRKVLGENSESVTIPPETTFNVLDAEGNVVASITYAKLTAQPSDDEIVPHDQYYGAIEVPADSTYTIEETNADIPGYTLETTITKSDETPPPPEKSPRKAAAAESPEFEVTTSNHLVAVVTNTYKKIPTGYLRLEKEISGLQDPDVIPPDTTFQIKDKASGEVVREVKYSKLENNKLLIELPQGIYTVEEVLSSAHVDHYRLDVIYSQVGYDDGGGSEIPVQSAGPRVKLKAAADAGDTIENPVTIDVNEFRTAQKPEVVTVWNNYTPLFGYLKITKEIKGLAEGVAMSDGTAFNVIDEEGNKVASLTYKDIKEGNNSIKLPTGDYTVVEDEDAAQVTGYMLTVEYPKEEVKPGTKGISPSVKLADGEDDTADTAEEKGAKVTITAQNAQKTPATASVTNIYTPIWTVTFDPVGGTPKPEDQKVPDGKKATEPTTDPTRDGYTFKGWTLEEEDYDFNSPVTKDITLVAKWEKNPTPVTPPVIPPVDPPVLNTKDHFAYIIGYPDGEVKPNGTITRAEVATVYFRMLTDESRDRIWSQSNSFSDVVLTDWFNNAISTMANGGIITGYPDGTFKPNGNITRAEFAAMSIRFFQDAKVGPSRFSDTIGHWAEEAISKALNEGLITGYPDGSFRPDEPITRAEAMTIFNRVLDRHPDKDHLLNNMIKWPDNMDTTKWYYAQVQEATNSHDYTMHGMKNDLYEIWQTLLPVRDWEAFEKVWSNSHAAYNPGDVINH